jgi:hypothetical protein
MRRQPTVTLPCSSPPSLLTNTITRHGHAPLSNPLKAEAKSDTLLESRKKPENAEKEKEKTEEWEIEDNQISTWILNSMEPRYCEQFIFTNTDYELWQEILQSSATKIILPSYMN